MRAALLGLWTLLAAADIAPEPARVQTARARAGPRVTRAREEAGVPRPRALLLRLFKEERLLEVWASAAPEGLYRIERFNPWSSFHLSMRLDDPNAADRARNPGVPASALGGRPVVSQGRGRSAG